MSQGVSSIGGGGNDYTFRLLFENGIIDSSSLADQLPELIIFERATPTNSYTVRAITGGSLTNPTHAPTTVTVLQSVQTPSGIYIDAIDPTAIDKEQINIAGIDLNEFGITSTSANQVLYGVEITSINGSGADIFGLNLTAADPARQFRAQAVPEPSTIIGSGVALGFWLLMKREYSRKRQNES